MLVSVVTPCLNPGPRLRRCLESVARQTHASVEHVVVDGGSTDGTRELLEAAGVRYVSEPDEGQTDAIVKGIRLAGGELLTWLNADDELLPQATARAVASGAEWVYGDCIVLADGRRTVWRPPPRFGARQVEAGEMVPQPGAFFTRDALRRAGGLDPSYELAMDVDLWIRLVDAGVTSRYVPEPLAVFEIHGGSKTGSVSRASFLLEHARALAASGRTRAASAAVGRALAFADVEVPSWADERVVRAAATAERGVESLRRRERGALALLSPEVWLVPESRRRLEASIRRALRIS